jgi:hypothetical protein
MSRKTDEIMTMTLRYINNVYFAQRSGIFFGMISGFLVFGAGNMAFVPVVAFGFLAFVAFATVVFSASWLLVFWLLLLDGFLYFLPFVVSWQCAATIVQTMSNTSIRQNKHNNNKNVFIGKTRSNNGT